MEREKVYPGTNVTIKEMCERYENVFTSAVNDALREKKLTHQTLPTGILPLREGMCVAGPAFTIKGSKDLSVENEMEERAKMLDSIIEDNVCVWETANDDESAQWGEIMTMASKMRGCRGAIVDGGVRDTDKVLVQNFPVFCRYRTSNGMLGRFRMHGYQTPVRIGGVTINPGDIIFGDIDGVIVVPQELALEILERAEYIRDNEEDIKKMVLSGLSPQDVVKNGGYF